jgi:hypothetical protein
MTDTDIDAAIIERARNGDELTETELLALDGADLLTLGMLADEVRRARVGDRVGFARVYEVGPGDPGTGAGLVVPAAAQEIRLSAAADTFEQTIDLIRQVRAGIGAGPRLTGFSLGAIAAREWGDLPAVLTAFRSAGLDALAEAPVDLVTPADVNTAAASGVTPQVLSVQRWPGGGRIPVLLRARAIASANPAITRFAPLSREQSVTAPTTGYHDVRMVALARLALPALPTIEVDWQQYGPKLAQVALMFGANHLDRVSPVDDATLGSRRASAEEVRRNIVAAGFTPADPGEAA